MLVSEKLAVLGFFGLDFRGQESVTVRIPTPRWTTYDAKIFEVYLPEGAPTSIQDRAYTSPIWYTPRG